MAITRLMTLQDAPVLARVLSENRDFLAPWDPLREDDFFTEETQHGLLQQALASHDAGTMVPLAITDADGGLVGRINIGGIFRGALESGGIGYWVGRSHNGHGLASAAVAEVKELAFRELGLHRLQAETLLHNAASQRVLERNGFERYGMAPQYLKIAGRWQDHVMFQVLAD
ncbi:GNAT family N-acetyltransferase [Arthrobacter sp. CJ23]|uniref:GNAT family N-acetyltransferase n=1 Tax=Arthrobacter sp. CJ23 TaxID=2972479 RepID=UPI00215C380E|nr:GNAT family protein [Arthrobacter sp. CJ23]UVJ40215.1 GNAT family N-acetyltransferase [Arthrobacter sp. CJ23]